MSTDKQKAADLVEKAEKAQKPPRIEVLKTTTEPLPVKLTEKDLMERGEELAAAQRELNAHADRKKSVNAALKADEEKIKEKIQRLSVVIQEKVEPREVEVEHILDRKLCKVTETRTDTKQVVRTREWLPHERQTAIPGIPGTEKKNGAANGEQKPPPPDLHWIDEGRRKLAVVEDQPGTKAGEYEILQCDDPSVWTSRWVPVKGQQKMLTVAKPLEEGYEECRKHHLGRAGDLLLKATGKDEDAAMTAKSLTNEAVAHKH